MYFIPQPQQIQCLKQENKVFFLSYNTKIVMVDATVMPDYALRYLKEIVKQYTGLSLQTKKSFVTEKNQINLVIDPTIKREQGYQLKITENGVFIRAATSVGLLYGVSTLRQIIIQAGVSLPYLHIEDYPTTKNRGFYHDITRGRIPTLDTMKRLADKLVDYKLNQLQLYIEHSYLFADESEVYRDDTPLTAEDILELDRYCKEREIELVPSLSTFGHLNKLLMTKSYAKLCELEDADQEEFSFFGRMAHHTIDVTNEKSLELITRRLGEFIPLFTSNQFNICADETFDLGKGRSKDYVEQKGLHEVYVEFVSKVAGVVSSYGKRPMFWGDIILGDPTMYQKLPRDIICLNWEYEADVNEEKAKKLYEIGATQYLCPGVQGWRRLMNDNEIAYENISRMCTYAKKYEAVGVLNTDWGDFGHLSDPIFSIPGLIYGAAFSWNVSAPPFDEMNRQISYLEYGDLNEQFVGIVSRMAKQVSAEWAHIAEFIQYGNRIRKEISSEVEYKSAMSEFLSEIPLIDATSCNNELQKELNALKMNVCHMDTSKRQIASIYFIHGEGQMILNQVGDVLKAYYLQSNQVNNQLISSELNQLAADLEQWFYYYKANWRQNYRESELYRVQDVICSIADFLREISK